jgi:hypothetical protein
MTLLQDDSSSADVSLRGGIFILFMHTVTRTRWLARAYEDYPKDRYDTALYDLITVC